LHSEKPDAQLRPHWLSEQVATAFAAIGQACWQLPQWLGSVRGSTQTLPQRMNGLWH
jgi:hypothetical protein